MYAYYKILFFQVCDYKFVCEEFICWMAWKLWSAPLRVGWCISKFIFSWWIVVFQTLTSFYRQNLIYIYFQNNENVVCKISFQWRLFKIRKWFEISKKFSYGFFLQLNVCKMHFHLLLFTGRAIKKSASVSAKLINFHPVI